MENSTEVQGFKTNAQVKTSVKEFERKLRHTLYRFFSAAQVWLKLVILLAVVFFFFYRLYDNTYSISKIEVPEELAKKGFSSKDMQLAILKYLRYIKKRAAYENTSNRYRFEADNTGEIKLDYQGISLNPTTWFPKRKNQISAAMYVGAHDRLCLEYTMRDTITNMFKLTDSLSSEHSINLLAFKAAKDIMIHIAPMQMILYKANAEDYIGALSLSQAELEVNVQKKERSLLYKIIGQCHQKLGNFEKSVIAYKKSINIDPNDPQSRIALTELYCILRFTGSAKKQLDTLDHLTKNIEEFRPDFLNMKGNYLSLIGKFSDAILHYKNSIELDSLNNNALHNIGRAYATIGDYRNATTALDLAHRRLYFRPDLDCFDWGLWSSEPQRKKLINNTISNLKNFKYGYFLIGSEAMRTQNYPRAEQLFREALKKDPTMFNMMYMLAEACTNSGKYLEAIEILQRIKRDTFYDFEVNHSLIKNYSMIHDDQSAQNCANIVLQTTKQEHQGLALMGYAKAYLKDRGSDALYYFLQALEVNPNDTWILSQLIEYKKNTKDFSGVITYANKMLENNPKNLQAMENVAIANFEVGNIIHAKNLSEEIVKRYPNAALTYKLLGKLYSQTDSAHAADSYQKYLRYYKNDVEANRYLAAYMIKLGKYKEALKFISEISIKDRTEIEYYIFATVDLHYQRTNQALSNLQMAMSINRENCLILKMWYGVLVELGRDPYSDPGFLVAQTTSGCDINDFAKKFPIKR